MASMQGSADTVRLERCDPTLPFKMNAACVMTLVTDYNHETAGNS
jgi:hypothetical protein